jgi:hypothetical protein
MIKYAERSSVREKVLCVFMAMKNERNEVSSASEKISQSK